jgi:uncharacterized Zn finger protein (UPF0148 family)
MLFDGAGEAVCPTCGARWRQNDAEVELVSRGARKASTKPASAKARREAKPARRTRRRLDS